jgi:hypothetical protein
MILTTPRLGFEILSIVLAVAIRPPKMIAPSRRGWPRVRHIAECKDYIAKQRDRIDRAIEQGRSTEVAETTLETLEASLRAFERQRRLLLDRLKERDR